MKYLTIVFISFFLINKMDAQTIEVKYESKMLAEGFIGKFGSLSLTEKAKLINNISNYNRYVSVHSDGNQIAISLDSLNQKCNAEQVSEYQFKQILIAKDNRWDKYLKIEESPNLEIYKINEQIDIDGWKVDSLKTKNILGFKCYYSYNESNPVEWAWFTHDIHIVATPDSRFPMWGVVLGAQNGRFTYLATEIRISKELLKLDSFNVNNNPVVQFDSFVEFSDTLMKYGTQMSTDMFECRKD